MGISIGAVGSPYGMSLVQPMNYPLKNESKVSEDFLEVGMQNAVMNVPPVRYPNAQEIVKPEEDSNPLKLSAETVRKSQEANRMYNDVASKFQGMTVGYSQDQAAVSYGMSGNSVDFFA
ncbi:MULTISPECIES: hypothetical protein [unclassified Butyrivibrio]|uniref:hypothetical protein n=1 Tax=unclassified Butyrivibrio TaxID=2639466 RepID=UPI0003B313DC|nr:MULTISPECIES: hypothetical protein [unclassified Butyrivibrio]MDC7294999.1 hypothetical protein [Butyrivibrio sp. DSM 10294]